MKIGEPNEYSGRCRHCGGRVSAGEGRMNREMDEYDGEWRWVVEHVEGECAGETEHKPRGAEIPRWAVPREGLTPGGVTARGLALVDSLERPAGAEPVNAAARARCVEEARATEESARRWQAYAWVRGIRPRPADVTAEQIDAMLGDADLADMDAATAAAREATGR